MPFATFSFILVAEEIERKFLVTGDAWRGLAAPAYLCQGYLSIDPHRTVRVRLTDDEAWLTVKGLSHESTRLEFEYEIQKSDAREMLDVLCLRPLLEKRRSRVPHAGLIWEVDEFLSENAGLIVAEVELASADQHVEIPAWAGKEVTGEPRYYNSSLLKNPYSHWRESV